MNKKSMMEHQFLYLFYVLFAILIFVFLVNIIKDMYTGEAFNKEFLVRDVGMMIESAYIGNGDLEVGYTLGQEFFIEIQNGVLLLRENKQSSYGSYLIAEGKGNLEIEEDNCNTLKILNKKNVELQCYLIAEGFGGGLSGGGGGGRKYE